jgi:predicted metal-dependent phosphoesterase TrpH
MRLRLDLHVHSNFSPDAIGDPRKLIAAARRRGLDGFALTDHNTSGGVDWLIERGLLREDGLPVDNVLVIPGVEVSTREGHLLCLGTKLRQMKGASAAEVCGAIHDQGGLAVAAHPFDRFRAGIPAHSLDRLPIDGIEAFNAATLVRNFNEQALAYARYRNLPITCGSDAHTVGAVGTAYAVIDTDDFCLSGVLRQLSLGSELYQRYLTVGQVAVKTLCNVMRLPRLSTLWSRWSSKSLETIS